MIHKELKFNITLKDIDDNNPCYPAKTKLGENWSGNLLNILEAKNISPEDKLWAVSLFAGDKINRLFAVHCARQALMLIENPDSRSITACDVAERFAKGGASKEELAAARAAAMDVAWDAAMDVAWDAAMAAAWDAAMDAAWVAARAAAWVAARDIAWDVAWDAQICFLTDIIRDSI